MKKLFCLLIAMVWAIPTFGQGPTPSAQGAITTSSSVCTTANACVTLQFPPGIAGVAIQVTQTFSGTLQFEASIDNVTYASIDGTPQAGGTAVTSTTTTGTWQFGVAGLKSIRVRASAFASGQAGVFVQSGIGAPAINGTTATVSISTATINGNAAAGTTGAAVPASADYLGVLDTTLAGLTGTSVGGKEALNVNVLGMPAAVTINTAATGAVTVAGSVTANAGTNLNTSALALEAGGHLASIDTSTSRDLSSAAAIGGASSLATTAYMAGCQNNTSISLTNGKQAELQCDTAGNLNVNVKQGGAVSVVTINTAATGAVTVTPVQATATNLHTAADLYLSGTAVSATAPVATRPSDGSAFISDAAIGAALSSNPIPVGCHNETSPTTIGNTQMGVPECDTLQHLIIVGAGVLGAPTGIPVQIQGGSGGTAVLMITDCDPNNKVQGNAVVTGTTSGNITFTMTNGTSAANFTGKRVEIHSYQLVNTGGTNDALITFSMDQTPAAITMGYGVAPKSYGGSNVALPTSMFSTVQNKAISIKADQASTSVYATVQGCLIP